MKYYDSRLDKNILKIAMVLVAIALMGAGADWVLKNLF